MRIDDLGIRRILDFVRVNSYDMGFWLDEYEDLFSDFDPRPYSRRQISDDFLFELKRRFREVPKDQKMQINLYLPKTVRDIKIESATKKRIKEHFDFEIKNLNKKRTKRKMTGFGYLAIGITILAINAYIEWEFSSDEFISLIGFILAPAGWFSAWTSFERFILDPTDETDRLQFYLRMQKANVTFLNMEDANARIESVVEQKV